MLLREWGRWPRTDWKRLLAVRGTAHVHIRGAEDAGRIAELGRLVTQRCPVAQTLLAAQQAPILLVVLRRVSEDLDLVRKSLESYLNGKRDAFARLHFVADNELLSMISGCRARSRPTASRASRPT